MPIKINYNGEAHTFGDWCEKLHALELQAFAKTLKFKGKISSAALYEIYRKRGGSLPMNSFLKRIPRTFRELRPDIRPYRTAKQRGYYHG